MPRHYSNKTINIPTPEWANDYWSEEQLQSYDFISNNPATDIVVISRQQGDFKAYKNILEKSAVYGAELEDYPKTKVLFIDDMDIPGTVALIEYLYTGALPVQHYYKPNHYSAFTLWDEADKHDLPEMKQQARSQLLCPDIDMISGCLIDTVTIYYGSSVDSYAFERLREDVVAAHAGAWMRELEERGYLDEMISENPQFGLDLMKGLLREMRMDGEKGGGFRGGWMASLCRTLAAGKLPDAPRFTAGGVENGLSKST